jgi:hypothetical protein
MKNKNKDPAEPLGSSYSLQSENSYFGFIDFQNLLLT